MPLTVTWPEIALRLALTILAAGLIGIDRDEHGRPAGLRTTLLVGLAAALSMIMVNAWLDTTGKASNSFVNLDLMRLPLGILTGVGFIGGGAIVRRDNRVLGVTTAATLWFVTVIGLCFGGGALVLGLVGTVLGLVTLILLKMLERSLPRDHRATLTLVASQEDSIAELDRALAAAKLQVTHRNVAYEAEAKEVNLELIVQWRGREQVQGPPIFLADFARHPGVLALRWQALEPER